MKKILSLVLVVVMLLSSVSVFATNFGKNIEIYSNGKLLELTNEPFAENDIIYLPLRELFEKANLLSDEDTYIKWDNRKIEILAYETVPSGEVDDANIKTLAYNYGLEIGKFEYVLNPGYEAMYQSRWGASNKKEMVNAPILRDSKTYIPAEYVEYLINRSMQYTKIEIINAE